MNKLFLLFTFIFISLNSFAFESNMKCNGDEKWSGVNPTVLSKEYFDYFQSTLEGDLPLKDSLLLSQKFLSQKNKDDFTKKLALYWKGRAYLQADLPHLALIEFNNTLKLGVKSPSIYVSASALNCINLILQKLPSIGSNKKISSSVELLSDRFPHLSTEYSLRMIKNIISHNAKINYNARELKLLKNNLAAYHWAQGLISVQKNDNRKSILEFESFFKSYSVQSPKLTLLKENIDYTKLLLARAYYAEKNYNKAQEIYKSIDNSSNLLPEKLSELGWSYLMSGNYSQSIGVSTQLQTAGLKSVFSPESWSILSMSLNELCQYPAAQEIIKGFYTEYKESIQWLNQIKGFMRNNSLYEVTAKFLENKSNANKIPEKLLLDWSKTSFFVNTQNEVHEIFKERRILEKNGFFNESKKLGARQIKLVKNIENFLYSHAMSMKNEIEKVSTSLQLVQVEVRTGASRDIVFQNAHEKLSENIKDGKYDQQLNTKNSTIWNWGNVSRSSGNKELWEDEIGALRSRMGNLCKAKEEFVSSRDKF